MERLGAKARERGVSIAIHTHVNAAQSVTPLVARATQAMLETGIRDVRNQGVLLRGVNDSASALLDLCFTLLDGAGIMPYYFYMCDMIPGSEHWRLSLAEAQDLQHQIMGYLPGFATPRMVCDVPYVGKRWVHQVSRYDTDLGISYWTKNYRTGVEAEDPLALSREYAYYDPIYLLPEQGQAWWRGPGPAARGAARRGAGRTASRAEAAAPRLPAVRGVSARRGRPAPWPVPPRAARRSPPTGTRAAAASGNTRASPNAAGYPAARSPRRAAGGVAAASAFCPVFWMPRARPPRTTRRARPRR